MAEAQGLGTTDNGTEETVLRFGHDHDGVMAETAGRCRTQGMLDLTGGESAPVRDDAYVFDSGTEEVDEFVLQSARRSRMR